MPIFPRSTYPHGDHIGWDTCHLCGNKFYRVELFFNSGSVEPQEDEVLTGATSAHTGTVEEVILEDGAWADGDAEGRVILTGATGMDLEDYTCFQADENVNGSVGGSNMLTLPYVGAVKMYAILHPKGSLIERDGDKYCSVCYAFRFGPKDRDETVMDIEEEEREI